MPFISKLKLRNFKRFQTLEIDFNDELNILVGDNACGKSSILKAIDLCLSANRKTVEEEKLKFLFNSKVIEVFLSLPKEERIIDNLPIVEIELFLGDCEIPEFVGANNSEKTHVPGLRLMVNPDYELGKEISQIIQNDMFSFPFEYYISSFSTFQGGAYSKYSCPIGFLFVDHSAIGEVTATNNYIRNLFKTMTDNHSKNTLSHNLRMTKDAFNAKYLQELTPEADQNFVLRTDKIHSISQSLSIETKGVDIMHEGKGAQSLIKTKFALERRTETTDVLLIEEPENHLSHSGMMKLLRVFKDHHEGQTIVSTHNSLIASGLKLNNLLIIGNENKIKLSLSDLDNDTANFFSKAPDHLLLEYILSKKALLVEGSAEYILLPVLYKKYKGRELEDDGIHLISVGGIKFKRYISISKALHIKTAFIQDNDGKSRDDILLQYLDAQDDSTSLIDKEYQYLGLNNDTDEKTFEEVLYVTNAKLMHELFEARVRTNSVLEYMLANKTKVALEIANFLESSPDNNFKIPDYINETFEWLQD